MRDDPGMMATFASAFACMDRLLPRSAPLTPSVIGPQRERSRWCPQDEDKLLELYRFGATYRDMSRQIGRTAHACRQKLYAMGYGRP